MTKTPDAKKRELIDGLLEGRSSLLEAIQALPPDRSEEVFLGVWSVNDLLAHLVGWDYTNRQAIQEILAGKEPAFFQYADKDWESYNRRLVEQYRIEPFPALLEALRESHRELIAYLESLEAGQMVNGKIHRQKGRTVTIQNLLRVEARDEQTHARQIREFFLEVKKDE